MFNVGVKLMNIYEMLGSFTLGWVIGTLLTKMEIKNANNNKN